MPSRITLPPLGSSRKSTDEKKKSENTSKCNASYDPNDYQCAVGPGSYNLPSSIGTNALYKSQPSYAISKTKRSFQPLMSEGPGILYYPDLSPVRHNCPHYKIGNSARGPASHFSLNITPGPIYEVKGTLGHMGPKIQSPKFRKSQKEHLDYKLYKLEGMFDEGVRRNKGCPIGKAAKHMALSNSMLPGPGQYDYMAEDKKGISFPKVRG